MIPKVDSEEPKDGAKGDRMNVFKDGVSPLSKCEGVEFIWRRVPNLYVN